MTETSTVHFSLPLAERPPCRECPFRRDSLAGWLGPYSQYDDAARMFIQDAFSESGMFCHMRPSGSSTPCVGSLVAATMSAKSYRMPTLEQQRLTVAHGQGGLHAAQILTVPEFIKHHSSIKELTHAAKKAV